MILELSTEGRKKVEHIKNYSDFLISSTYYVGFKPNKEGIYPKDRTFNGKTFAQAKVLAYSRFQPDGRGFEEVKEYCSPLAVALAFWEMCETFDWRCEIIVKRCILLEGLGNYDEYLMPTVMIDDMEFAVDASRKLNGGLFHTLESIKEHKPHHYLYDAETLKHIVRK